MTIFKSYQVISFDMSGEGSHNPIAALLGHGSQFNISWSALIEPTLYPFYSSRAQR